MRRKLFFIIYYEIRSDEDEIWSGGDKFEQELIKLFIEGYKISKVIILDKSYEIASGQVEIYKGW